MQFQISFYTGVIQTFVQNFSDVSKSIAVEESRTDLITGETVSGEITLPAFGVMVLK